MDSLERPRDIHKSLMNQWGGSAEDILFNMTHEFKTPISIIETNVQLLKRVVGLKLKEEALDLEKYFEKIMHESQRLENIVEDTVELVRVYNSQENVDSELKVQTLNMPSLISNLLKAENMKVGGNLNTVENSPVKLKHPEMFNAAILKILKVAQEVIGDDEIEINIEGKGEKWRLEFFIPNLVVSEPDKESFFEPFTTLTEFNKVEDLPLRMSLVKNLLLYNGFVISAATRGTVGLELKIS